MAMSEAQAVHLQSVTTALTGIADASDAMIDRPVVDGDLTWEDETAALELARDIARRVINGESHDLAADAVRADWAAAGGGPIEDVDPAVDDGATYEGAANIAEVEAE